MAKEKKDKKWIQDAIKNPGSFTGKAKKRGITTAQLQANVEKNPEEYDEKLSLIHISEPTRPY